jgi:hypothetical protein
MSKLSFNRRPILLALLGLAAAAGAWAAPCLEAEIVEAPANATVGELFPVKGAIKNCGDRPAGFVVSWLLVSESGDRIVLARRAVSLNAGRTLVLRARLLVREAVHPGHYDLTLYAEGRRGLAASDSSPIIIHPDSGPPEEED